jgi:hypothetical protein
MCKLHRAPIMNLTPYQFSNIHPNCAVHTYTHTRDQYRSLSSTKQQPHRARDRGAGVQRCQQPAAAAAPLLSVEVQRVAPTTPPPPQAAAAPEAGRRGSSAGGTILRAAAAPLASRAHRFRGCRQIHLRPAWPNGQRQHGPQWAELEGRQTPYQSPCP